MVLKVSAWCFRTVVILMHANPKDMLTFNLRRTTERYGKQCSSNQFLIMLFFLQQVAKFNVLQASRQTPMPSLVRPSSMLCFHYHYPRGFVLRAVSSPFPRPNTVSLFRDPWFGKTVLPQTVWAFLLVVDNIVLMRRTPAPVENSLTPTNVKKTDMPASKLTIHLHTHAAVCV